MEDLSSDRYEVQDEPVVEHRRIITGPINVRDWRVICLCGERVTGPSAKAARAAWERHAGVESDR